MSRIIRTGLKTSTVVELWVCLLTLGPRTKAIAGVQRRGASQGRDEIRKGPRG